MSAEQEHARVIAERIARRVAGRPPATLKADVSVSAELSAVRASLSELERTLARIESKVSGDSPVLSLAPESPAAAKRAAPLTHSPWLAGVNATAMHPSQERFGVEEAVVSELVDFFEKEKACSLETDKPCDHCEMCSSRGF